MGEPVEGVGRPWLRWLGWLVPREHREFVLGDLEELYLLRSRRAGPARAFARTLWDVLASAISLGSMGSSDPAGAGRTTGGGDGRPPIRPRASLLPDLGHDVREALRAIRREKGFTALTVSTLALGIGSTAAVFGVVNQLVLRPLPGVTDPDGVAYVQLRSRANPESTQGRGIATRDFDELRRAIPRGLASYGNSQLFVSAEEGQRPIMVWAGSVYGDYFEVLGVQPREGRLLTADDNAFGADPHVAVIGEELSARLFGPDARAAGRTIVVNGRSVRVLGVTADGFQGAERGIGHQMWFPYPALAALTAFTEERLLDRNSVMHNDLLVRLRRGDSPEGASPEDASPLARSAAGRRGNGRSPEDAAPQSPSAAGRWGNGRSPEEIEARMAAVLDRIGEAIPEHGEYLADLRPTLVPGLTTPPAWREMTRRTLSVLAGIVGLVLLLATMNAANLLLFRNVAHRGGAAVRRALGASSGRIARSHLVRSLLLAGMASVAGLAVAWLVTLPLRGESLVRTEAIEAFSVDGRVLAFAVGAAVLTTLLFGTLPAVLAGRFDLQDALRAASRGDTGQSAGLRSLLAAGQVGISLAILVGGVMLTRTIAELYSIDTGFAVENVATLPLELPDHFDDEQRLLAYRSVVRAVEARPDIVAVGGTVYGPQGPRLIGRLRIAGSPEDARMSVEMIPATAGWFEALEIADPYGAPIRFDEAEWRPGSVVLSASLARRLFGGAEEAMGRTLVAGFGDMEEVRVVAVTSELRHAARPTEDRDAFIVPLESGPLFSNGLVVRARSLDAPTLNGIRETVEQAVPDVPVVDPWPVRADLDRIHSESRLFGKLLSLLSGLAVLLAAVGLYGVVAFAVAARRREFGVRIALGAGASAIAGLVVRFAGSILAAGTLIGLLGGYVLAATLESRLFGVEALDLLSYMAAVVVFLLAAALACWMPTRRAVSVDPVTALRAD